MNIPTGLGIGLSLRTNCAIVLANYEMEWKSMKEKKRFGVIACILIILAILIPVQSQAATIKISKKNATLFPGKTINLQILGNSKKVKWSSSNKSIAKVNSFGKVTGLKRGKAIIEAKVNGKTYTCTVKVSRQSKKSALRCYRLILNKLYYNIINNSFSYTDGSQYFNNMGYAFRDINADGSYELVIGSADKPDSLFFKMYSIVDGKPKLIVQTSGWYRYHLCENNRIKEEVSSLSVNYCILKHGRLKHGKSIEQPFYEDDRYPPINIKYKSFRLYPADKKQNW